MTITYRLVKGTPLTNAEVDENFSTLDDKASNLQSNVGVLANLATTAKSNLVSAINETRVLATGYTDSNARRSISVTGAGSYDNTTGVITVTGGVTSVAGASGAISNVQVASGAISSGILNTANVAELTNQYFTPARARQSISVTGSGSYDNSTGVITITGGVVSVGGATGAVSNAALLAGITSAGGGSYIDTSDSTQTKSGNLILSGNIQAIGGFIDSTGTRLTIKDQNGSTIWG